MNKRILLVEDDFLVGLNIHSTLTEAGFEVAGPAVDVKAALKLIAENDFHCAVLDINLNGHYSDEVASGLTALGVPFLLLTGYVRDNLPVELAKAPLIEKPFEGYKLIEMLKRLCS